MRGFLFVRGQGSRGQTVTFGRNGEATYAGAGRERRGASMIERGWAHRHKWMLIAAYALVQAAVYFFGWPILMVSNSPRVPSEGWLEPGYLYQAGVWIPCVMILQCAFVLPVRKPASSVGGKWLTGVIAALAVAILAALMAWVAAAALAAAGVKELEFDGDHVWHAPFWVGGGVGLLAAPFVIRRCRAGVPVQLSVAIAAVISGVVVAALVAAAYSAVKLVWQSDESAGAAWAVGALITLVVSWGVSTPLLLAFVRRTHPEYALSRIASILFLGTLIEAAAIIPLDVMVRRKSSCYCGEGTFFALTALWSVGLLVLGPAVYLLPLGRRRKRLMDGKCGACGYDMSAAHEHDRCPECGAGWKKQRLDCLEPRSGSDE
jgi:hypothetical protein